MRSWAAEHSLIGDTRLIQGQGDSVVPSHHSQGTPQSRVDSGEAKVENILVWTVNRCAPLCCNMQAVHSEQDLRKICIHHYQDRLVVSCNRSRKNFDSELFKALCKLLETVKTRTTLYRQVGHYSQLVLNSLQSFFQPTEGVGAYLPSFGMGVQFMLNTNTGFSPNLLQLGKEVNIPAYIMLGVL